MSKGSLRFRYTSDQWLPIMRAIDGWSLDIWGRAYFREFTERLTGRYLATPPAEDVREAEGREIVRLHEMYGNANDLMIMLREAGEDYHYLYDDDDGDLSRRPSLTDTLEQFLYTIEKEIDELTYRRTPNSANPRKQKYLYDLCNIWAFYGNKVGSSEGVDRNGKRRVGGPMIRFLIAASAPAFPSPLTPDGARGVIRRYKREAAGRQSLSGGATEELAFPDIPTDSDFPGVSAIAAKAARSRSPCDGGASPVAVEDDL